VIYRIGKKYSRFQATVGIRDGANGGRGSVTPLTFRVVGDGKELWKSAPIQKCGETRDCTVSVAGVERLELRVDCPGEAFCAHAVWAEPSLEEEISPPKPPRPRPNKNTDKPPAPSGDELAESLRQVREEFKDAYARDGGKRGLAKQLYDKAFKAFHRSAQQYAYFHESALVAGRASDFATALEVVDHMHFRWDINTLELKGAILEQAAAGAAKPDQSRTVAEKALLLSERGVMTEQFDLAGRLLRVARTAADKADVKEVLRKSVEEVKRRLEQVRSDYEAIQTAVRTLEDKPEDAESNRAVGIFRCALKGDWAGGLPLVAKSNDKALAEAAEKDLADPDKAAAQVKLADGWYDLAVKEQDKKIKAAWQQRAYDWYEDAWLQPSFKADRARVKARLQTLRQQLGLVKPWQHMEIGDAKVLRTPSGVLRLRPHHRIATRQWYGQALEVTVVALLAPRPLKNHVRFTLFNGGDLSVTFALGENNKLEYVFNYVAFSDPDGRGIGPNSSATSPRRDEPVRLRYLVKSSGVEVYINESRIGGPFKTNWKVESPSPIRIWSDDSEVDLVSVTVRRIHEK
jgi:hypothetical protein